MLTFLFRKKKRHVYIAFKVWISKYEVFDKLIEFILKEWEKRKVFFSDYKMIYPKLMTSMRWKFDYVLFEKKKKMEKSHNVVLENLCDKIIDVVGKTFIKKYYFVKISQSKRGHVYLMVWIKEAGCLKKKNKHFKRRFVNLPGAFFSGSVTKTNLLANSIFFILGSWKNVQTIIFVIFWFQVINMSTNIFHVIYFCQHTFEGYFKLPAKDKKIFFLYISFIQSIISLKILCWLLPWLLRSC